MAKRDCATIKPDENSSEQTSRRPINHQPSSSKSEADSWPRGVGNLLLIQKAELEAYKKSRKRTGHELGGFNGI